MGPGILDEALKYILQGKFWVWGNCYTCWVFGFSSKVSERQTCALAAAFAAELTAADAVVASSKFLEELARLHTTGHEHRLEVLLERYGLQAPIKTSFYDIGLARQHPVLRIQDVLQGLSKAGKLEEIFLQHHTWEDFREFWSLFRNHRPRHPVFSRHPDPDSLSRCVPIFLHADEGSGQKKKGLLVLQFQPVLAKGSRRSSDLNFAGNTFLNRVVYAVLSTTLYNRKNAVLYQLLDHWAADLSCVFESGVPVIIEGKKVTLFPIVLGLKGDLQGLIKCGRLNRSFLRDAPASLNPPGICHLCQAGRNGFPWHRTDIHAEWLRDPHAFDDEPWSVPSPLLKIPCDLGAKFFLVDVFHTAHKGIMGDFAANCLVTRLN